MRPGIGLILRLVGPLLEVCLILAMFQVRGRHYRALGLDAETWVWVGIFLCIGLIFTGIILSRKPARPRDRWDLPRESR